MAQLHGAMCHNEGVSIEIEDPNSIYLIRVKSVSSPSFPDSRPESCLVMSDKLELKNWQSRRSLDRPKFLELCGPSPIAGSNVWDQTL